MNRRSTASPHFKSALSGAVCRHRHLTYREARDCGYKREKKEGAFPSSVVDQDGASVSAEAGRGIDERIAETALEARQAARREESLKLRQEIHARDVKQWWNPYRPRDRGES